MTSAPFDELVARLDPAMAVVTTVVDDERAGCLVGFHAQCSIEPQRYAVWLSKANHTYRVALRSTVLAVHFLDRSQEAVARLFGTRSGDEIDKFAHCRWEPGAGGVPVLQDCPNRFVGRRVALLDEGSDHVCLVLEPTDAQAGDSFTPLRLSDVAHLHPGHEAEERPTPPTERAG